MLFINTRPSDRAAALTHALQQAHIPVLELALLELRACSWSLALNDLYQQLFTADVIIVVSPSAAKIGLSYLAQAGLDLSAFMNKHWIAVGEATAKVLSQYGIQSLVPKVETSEGMLRLAELSNLSSQSVVAFWRGEGGRQFMMDTLLEQRIHILNFVLYERYCPIKTQKEWLKYVSLLEQEEQYCMLISSEASWLNWLDLIHDHSHLLNRGYFWVLGERLSQILQQYQQQHYCHYKIKQLHDLKIDSILQQIEIEQGNA